MSEIKSEVRSEVMTSEPAEQRAYVESLIIEITRRCNMRCAHCLRGDAQDMDISKESLDKIFQPVEHVGTLTFTGGEPALRPQLLMDALETAKRHHTMVERVYIVTNGKEVPDEFMSAVHAWHQYALEGELGRPTETLVFHKEAYAIAKSLSKNASDGVYGAWVDLSMDCYHEPVPLSNIHKLATLPHLGCGKYQEDASGDWVISEGRAAENDLGRKTLRERRPWYFDESGKILEMDDVDSEDWPVSIEEVMFAADGGVLKCCDASYETQKEIRHFTLSDLDESETWLDRSIARWRAMQ